MEGTLTLLPIDLLDAFPSHPFRLKNDAEFLDLLKSISSHGVLQPIAVRKTEDRYQILAGHRRKRVCEILQFKEIPAIVYDCDDAQATLLMLDSNLQQRQNLLPSEKAFAYRMKLEILNKSPGRPKKYDPDGAALQDQRTV